jgi:hypothetical protein
MNVHTTSKANHVVCSNNTQKFSWVDQINYTVLKSWKALHFVMLLVKNGKYSVQVTSTSDSRLWGCVLGPIQGM